jgi:hypothetical protein
MAGGPSTAPIGNGAIWIILVSLDPKIDPEKMLTKHPEVRPPWVFEGSMGIAM